MRFTTEEERNIHHCLLFSGWTNGSVMLKMMLKSCYFVLISKFTMKFEVLNLCQSCFREVCEDFLLEVLVVNLFPLLST